MNYHTADPVNDTTGELINDLSEKFPGVGYAVWEIIRRQLVRKVDTFFVLYIEDKDEWFRSIAKFLHVRYYSTIKKIADYIAEIGLIEKEYYEIGLIFSRSFASQHLSLLKKQHSNMTRFDNSTRESLLALTKSKRIETRWEKIKANQGSLEKNQNESTTNSTFSIIGLYNMYININIDIHKYIYRYINSFFEKPNNENPQPASSILTDTKSEIAKPEPVQLVKSELVKIVHSDIIEEQSSSVSYHINSDKGDLSNRYEFEKCKKKKELIVRPAKTPSDEGPTSDTGLKDEWGYKTAIDLFDILEKNRGIVSVGNKILDKSILLEWEKQFCEERDKLIDDNKDPALVKKVEKSITEIVKCFYEDEWYRKTIHEPRMFFIGNNYTKLLASASNRKISKTSQSKVKKCCTPDEAHQMIDVLKTRERVDFIVIPQGISYVWWDRTVMTQEEIQEKIIEEAEVKAKQERIRTKQKMEIR